MNGSRVLLDTNLMIALFAEDSNVHEHIANVSEVFVPAIAIGELYFGAYKSQRAGENIARIDEFVLNNLLITICEVEIADILDSAKTFH